MATITKKQHIPIFVSSTFEDMQSYRDTVGQSIASLEHIAKGMELFGSSPMTPLDKCLSEVRQSSLFICLIGMRYGSIEEKSGLSYTYLEYKEAVKNNIPVLVYILSDDAPVIAKYVDKGDKAELLDEFKKVLTTKHMYSNFDSPSDLKSKVIRDIVRTLEEMENVEISKDDILENAESSVEVMKKFLQRPKKYNGKEVELTVKIDSDFRYGWVIDFLDKIGLDQGDTIGVSVKIIDESGNEMTEIEEIDLHTDGELADVLEGYKIGDLLKIRSKLAYVIFNKMQEHDGGITLSAHESSNLILTEIL